MMRIQAFSLLAVFAGIAWANPWGITSTSDRQPFWTTRALNMALDGPLFHAFTDANPSDPSLVQLFELVRFGGAGAYDHLYTTSQAEKDIVKPPSSGTVTLCVGTPNPCNLWVEGVEDIYVWNVNAPGRVPLYRFWTGTFHFYSLDQNEGLSNGFTDEGIAGYVLPGPVAGSTQFYRWRTV